MGIKRDQFGIAPHGLRHEYANDHYEEVSGEKSVVCGGSINPNTDPDNEARHTVTNELGHARLSNIGAYTGARKIGRPTSKK